MEAESAWNALDNDAKECFADEWFEDPGFCAWLVSNGADPEGGTSQEDRETEKRLFKIKSGQGEVSILHLCNTLYLQETKNLRQEVKQLVR